MGETDGDPSTSGPRSLPMSPFQGGLIEACRKLAGRPRESALNAVEGLRRAWILAEIDPEIALFRAITAEEEAATALLFALRQRGYPGAKALNPQKHPDKIGLAVLVGVLGQMFKESGWPNPMLQLHKDQRRPRIDAHLPSEGLGLGDGFHITPDEPLNLTIKSGSGEGVAEITLFKGEFETLAKDRGARSVKAHIESEAALRNTLLYASDQGVARVAHPDPFILERKRRVFVLLGVTIIILQTKAHQLLVVQALEAYLLALERPTNVEFDYSPAEPTPDLVFNIVKTADGSPRALALRKRGDEAVADQDQQP